MKCYGSTRLENLWRRYRSNKLKALKIRKATLAVNNVFEDFVGCDWLHFKITAIGTDEYKAIYIKTQFDAMQFFAGTLTKMLKPFHRESWRRSSELLRNKFRLPDCRFVYLLQICHMFIVDVLNRIVKSVVIGNIPHFKTKSVTLVFLRNTLITFMYLPGSSSAAVWWHHCVVSVVNEAAAIIS